jgi:DNA invertase Pin-like site-specific DNA recombinase
MIRAAYYGRVSTIFQSLEGCSLDNQEAKALSYAALNDMTIVDKIVDAGLSAKNLNRAGMQALIELVKGGKVDAVITYSLSRASRSVKDIISLTELFEKHKVAFHSIQEKIDTKSALGRFFLNVLSSLSQMERELTAERVTDALSHKIRSGQRVGSVPYGYSLAPDGKTLFDDPHEQEGIALILDCRAKGWGYRKICRELTAQGFRAKGGSRVWSHPKIISIIAYQERRRAV